MMFATGETLLERDETGTVLVSFDGGFQWVRFRTENAFRKVLADISEQMAHWPAEDADRFEWADDRLEQDLANVRDLYEQSRRHHPTARVSR